MSLKVFAPSGVEFARHKKGRGDNDENKIVHATTMTRLRASD